MRKLAIIDKNPNIRFSQWRTALEPKCFFKNDNELCRLNDFKPDVLFINKGNTFVTLPQYLKKYKSVYFYGDYYQPLPHYVHEYMALCTAVCMTNRAVKGANYTPLGADTDIFKPVKIEKKYDIVFGGNYFGSNFIGADMRLALVRHLQNSGYNFLAVGNGWPKDVDSIPMLSHFDYNTVINQTKLTVGMSHFIDIAGYTSNRLFQMMATGTPHIAWASPGIKNLFENGYIEVNSYDQLNEIIDYLFANDHARESAGEKQRRQILKHHTIDHAWQRIEKVIEKL